MGDIHFYTSQVGGENVVSFNHSLSPAYRLYTDIRLFFKNFLYLPMIILPFRPLPPGFYAELNLKDPANLLDMLSHVILLVAQLTFCLGVVPFYLLAPLPSSVVILAVALFLLLNKAFCTVFLNGFHLTYESDPKLIKHQPAFPHEHWIFLNGVAVGSHWLKANINRLSLTFGRAVTGIHNPTSGILFDVIQCLIQRNFDYNTGDIRHCYAVVKSNLYNPKYQKIVFLMHSQGAIEGSMIIDWLLQEVPQDLLMKLEVYSFGAAANHFNNPYHWRAAQTKATLVASGDGLAPPERKALRHIEHYANETDFVARWGVLEFTKHRATLPSAIDQRSEPTAAAFMGRVFVRPGVGGHQFNQHYLDYMFPLELPKPTAANPHPTPRCRDSNMFMEMKISHSHEDGSAAEEHGASKSHNGGCKQNGLLELSFGPLAALRENLDQSVISTGLDASPVTEILDASSPLSRLPVDSRGSDHGPLQVKHFSRLWMYRNGKTPADDSLLFNRAIRTRGTL